MISEILLFTIRCVATVLAIMRFLHCADNTKLDPTDKMTKLRPLIDQIKKCFLKNYLPEQNMAYDESMIEYFGKHGFAIPVPKERQLGFQDHSALENIMSSWEAPTRWMPTLTCIESELEARGGGGQHLHGSLIAVFKILEDPKSIQET
ncbi:hypothetical protein JTB14_032464 [Gonioctena quinquepunctata]|nr:hypothetical protein JTB14_032464 [Gonioctena quinquepunctata]